MSKRPDNFWILLIGNTRYFITENNKIVLTLIVASFPEILFIRKLKKSEKKFHLDLKHFQRKGNYVQNQWGLEKEHLGVNQIYVLKTLNLHWWRAKLVLCFRGIWRPRTLQDAPDSWVYYRGALLSLRVSGVQSPESISQLLTDLWRCGVCSFCKSIDLSRSTARTQ